MHVIIVGAGASGLMAAIKCRERHIDVTLIEKNEKVGKKIYITGKGRCNVTNNCDKQEFLNNVVRNSKFLYSAINYFSSQDTIEFFNQNNVPLVTERGSRVFPKSYKASDISNCLLKLNRKLGTTILLNETVLSIEKKDNTFSVKTNKSVYTSEKVIIATGGISYPLTGSTGDGYKFAKKFNHTVIDLVPGLCTFKIKETIPSRLIGFTQKNIRLTVNGTKTPISEFGDITFYSDGISGPIALTISSQINRLDQTNLSICIDFKPALDMHTLDNRLLKEINSKNSSNVKELLRKLLPGEILDFFLKNTDINPNSLLNELTKEDRQNIVKNLKQFKLTYIGLDDIQKAVVTSGGVSTKEINPNTMESKLVSGLYFIGEIIDVDAFTGGFNLQIAFSTAALCSHKL